MAVSAKLQIRDAHADEASFIAWAVLSAMGYDQKGESFQSMHPGITEICSREDTLYSYKRTRMATLDGIPVGCLVSYDGADYQSMVPRTWKMFSTHEHIFTEEDFLKNAIETQAGEYYLDSLAVKQAYRGEGIGKVLLQDGILLAKRKGFKKVTLIVESDHRKLALYYSSIGFKPEGSVVFFGEDYTKMSLTL